MTGQVGVFTLGNMGTPLMWMGCGHLLFLNLLLGWGEGSLLARWGKVKSARAVWVMIAANYVSAWLGYVVLPPLLRWLERDLGSGPPLYGAEWILIAAVAMAIVVTIVLELPFVMVALRGSSRGPGARALAAVWVQGVSYAVLVALYLMISPMSAITECERVRDLSVLEPPKDAWVYYADERWGHLWRVRPDGTQRECVAGLLVDPLEDDWWGRGLWARASGDGAVEILMSERRGRR